VEELTDEEEIHMVAAVPSAHQRLQVDLEDETLLDDEVASSTSCSMLCLSTVGRL
jgi:hypothetical protein